MVDQALKTWDVPAENVLFEIAESAMIADAERSVAVLTRLRAIGAQLAIDDFGSGFSSLAHLKRFPIQEIKIDRPFVAGMLDDPGDRALVHAAIDLAHHFGLRAVAEGVERKETLEALAQMGCDVAQGTLFSPALAPDRFADWWEKHAVPQ
jgi:EAL domain-containing protein (putative c-di-GMP-specific phosphodiesterase class I)